MTEFKVGDMVKVLNIESNRNCDVYRDYIGLIGEVRFAEKSLSKNASQILSVKFENEAIRDMFDFRLEKVKEEKKMQIEVGKKYVDNNGEVITIISDISDYFIGHKSEYSCRFIGTTNGFKYFENYTIYGENKDNIKNPNGKLIKEYREPVEVSGWVVVFDDGSMSIIYKNKKDAIERKERAEGNGYEVALFISLAKKELSCKKFLTNLAKCGSII
jgi:hypothetical protein